MLKKRRRARERRGMLLTPFGGRPSNRKQSRRDGDDDGDGPWSVQEKDGALVSDDEGDDDYAMERKGYYLGQDADAHGSGIPSAYAVTRNPSNLIGLGKPSASPVAGIAAKIREVSGRIVSNSRPGGRGGRFSMLEDEDREDLLWKGEEEAEESDSAHDDGRSHTERQEKRLPILPPVDGGSRDIDLSPRTPTRADPFSDHLDEYYDSNMISYADGNSLSRKPAGPTTKSSANSRDSMTESMLAASEGVQQVARRVSMKTAEASYLPIKRRDSWIQRMAGGSVASLFRGGKTSSTSLHPEQGFLDPTTPPALDSIREDAHSRNASSFMSNFGYSVSSFVSAVTANTAMLDRYNQMDIIQRDASGSSSYVPPQVSDSAVIARNAGLPPVPMKRDMNRPVTPPRGPRPAPLRLPSHIDVGSGAARRPVKDIAASINRRGSVLQDAIPLEPTSGETMQAPSYMDSPSRRLASSPAGPRRQTIYQAVPKVPLVIANNS
ncbi:hypothetical protein QFC22_004465 [Naganishia vaughanmartiniae]|uniref:Uncharacterized protein n=1 Tax=Naganishia vaughanmartiniae TaxID=1424756 RepID=A0ACC2X2J1_9TREE|nr:hypothetical protein QFC22_004465 [Naganishia vaughanmartiniae]